ncbi:MULTISPECIES: hypothetical protein [unclassified Streptomyces]|uniref:hypothetical protein n=1 Tax=unclassified Streptomyces TaxID=2593676 RepID=UPI00131E176B|nr:hypothetical protein [Streptomyces sp. CB01635]
MLTISRWIDKTLQSLTAADDRRMLAAFAQWHELPRLRQRLGGRLTTGNQVNGIRQQIREAARLLQWLRDHGTELSRCDQGHIDEWLFEAPASVSTPALS